MERKAWTKTIFIHLIMFLLTGMAVMLSAWTGNSKGAVYAATTPVLTDGVYQIGTADELMGFVELVNTGAQGSYDAVLTKNIDLTDCTWTPIGTLEYPYQGTFNGNGYTVSNYAYTLNCTETEKTKVGAGFFGYVMGTSTIENLTVEGTFSITGGGYPESIGGIIGYAGGTEVTIENVCSKIAITVDAAMTGVENIGGIVGEAGGGADTALTINRCSNYENINLNSTAAEYIGGIAGLGVTQTILDIDNCANHGDIENIADTTSYAAGILGYVDANNGYNFRLVAYSMNVGSVKQPIMTMVNYKFYVSWTNYFLKDSYTDTTSSTYGSRYAQELFSSGNVAYKLNGSVDAGTNWYQNLSGENADAYPVLDTTHGLVYYDDESVYANAHLTKKIKNIKAISYALVDGEAFPDTVAVETKHVSCAGITWKNEDGTAVDSEIAEPEKNYLAEITFATTAEGENTYEFSDSMTAGAITVDGVALETAEWNNARTEVVVSIPMTVNIRKISAENYTEYGLTEEELEKYAGAFAVSTAEEMLEFAQIVNINGITDISGVLIEDIDFSGLTYTPIGIENNYFSGKMYGRNHCIKNLVLNAYNDDGVALFGQVTGGFEAYDITLDASCKLLGYSYVAGIAGWQRGSGTIKIAGCGNEASITARSGQVAGILGFATSDIETSIENCYNTGTIDGGSFYRSFAIAHTNENCTVKNCYNIGEIAGAKKYFTYTTGNITNCYQIDTNEMLDENATYLPAEDFASGRAAWLLNGAENGGEIWRQNLLAEEDTENTVTADDYPVVDKSHGKVYFDGESVYANTPPSAYKLSEISIKMDTLYRNGDFPKQAVSQTAQAVCTGITWQTTDKIANGQESYEVIATIKAENTEELSYIISPNILPENIFLNDTAATSAAVLEDGTLQAVFVVPTQKLGVITDNNYHLYGLSLDEYIEYIGYRVISDAEELLMFAEYVNAGNTNSNAILAADIDLSGKEWTPIGKEAALSYTGTFDGRGHRICNLIYENATQKSVGLFGEINSGAKINGVIIDKTCSISAYQQVGGIVGRIKDGTGAVYITNCGNEAAISGSSTYGWIGGIVGIASNDDVHFENCYNAGKVSAESSSVVAIARGGVLGSGTAKNCYNVGKIVASSKSTNTKGKYLLGDEFTATNCYQLIGEDTTLRDGITELSAEQFASGEAAYLLNGSINGGSLFRQNLTVTEGVELDTFPVLDINHEKVYSDGEGNFGNAVIDYKLSALTITCAPLTKGDKFPQKVTVEGAYADCESVTWQTTDAVAQGQKTYQAQIVLKAAEGMAFGKALTKETVTLNKALVTEVAMSEDAKILTITCEMTALAIGSITESSYESFGLSAEEYSLYAGYYAIDSADALMAFAELVNAGNTDVNGVLIADIDLTGKSWIPIGIADIDENDVMTGMYTGTFDGRGHRRCHMQTNAERSYQGLFETVGDGACLKNVIIDKSCEITAESIAAGLAAMAYMDSGEKVTITGCGNEATVVSTGSEDISSCAAGIIGCVSSENGELWIDNSYNSGNITAEYAGAIMGEFYTWYNVAYIKDCLNTGVITDTRNQYGLFADGGTEEVSFSNCYHIINDMHTQAQVGVEMVKAEQLASGEVAYLLNHKENGGDIWRQNLPADGVTEVDITPVLDRSHAMVYTDGISSFSNEKVNCRINSVSMELDLFGNSSFPKEVLVHTAGISSSIAWNTQDETATAGQNYVAEITLKTDGEGDYFNTAITTEDVQVNGENAESITLNADGTLTVTHSFTAKNISKITADNYAEFGLDAEEYAAYAGWYAIGNETELFTFAELANSKDSDCHALLTKDVTITEKEWIPIGTMEKPYTGTFDGRGYRIDGMSITAEDITIAGFFGAIENTTIKNLTVDGEIALKAENVQVSTGIVAVGLGDIELKNLVNEVNITDSETVTKISYAGGVLGVAGSQPYVELTILNCVNKGDILAGSAKVSNAGGIVSYAGWDTYTMIKNCINYGAMPQKAYGILGYVYDESNYFKGIYNCLNVGTSYYGIAYVDSEYRKNFGSNNYYLAEVVTNGEGHNVTAVAVTAEQLSSGEIAYLLNESVSGAEGFRQNLTGNDADVYPVMDDSHAKVYCNYKDCLGETIAYSNSAVVEETHTYDTEGICAKCGYCEADKKYYISSRSMLTAFANRVNSGNTARDVVLTEDIVVGNTVHIGTLENPYAGTFDGNGHSIHVAYKDGKDATALFAHLSGTVENLTVKGSISTNGKYAAGIAGVSHGATIRNCISKVAITSSFAGTGMHGGVVGLCQGGNISSGIENCAFTGSITGNATTDCAGIVGYAAGNTVITNSYVYAEFSLGSADTGSKAICGNGANAVVTNCYYLAGGVKDTLGEEKTAEEFSDGAVAYLLNGAASDAVIWYQNLGETDATVKDAYPTLNENENTIVYYFAEYEKYSNNPDWLDTLLVPVVKELPKLSGVYGTAVENLVVSGGVVAESNAEDATIIDGTWMITGENLSEILEVDTTAECVLKFIPDKLDVYQKTEILVIPEITPFTLSADNASITLGDALTENGSEQVQTITSVQVTVDEGLVYTLKEGTDYHVTGDKATAAGKYTLTLTGCGNYQGAVTAEYAVAEKDSAGGENGAGSGNEAGNGSGAGSENGSGSGNEGGSGNESGSGNEAGSGNGDGSTGNAEIGKKFEVKGLNYRIKTKNEVIVIGVASKTLKTIKIPTTVKNEGISYKVTEIAGKAFKGNKKVSKVIIGKNVKVIGASAFEKCKKLSAITIGKNVAKIGKKAFYGSNKLKKITIKTSKLTNKNVGKQAFKNIHKKATIKVPKKKLKAYKTLLKKKGVGKNVKISK